jgi:hypothetical protein
MLFRANIRIVIENGLSSLCVTIDDHKVPKSASLQVEMNICNHRARQMGKRSLDLVQIPAIPGVHLKPITLGYLYQCKRRGADRIRDTIRIISPIFWWNFH